MRKQNTPSFLICPQALPPLRLPAVSPAASIRIDFLPDLTRRARKLHSGLAGGVAVHAGSFLRERRMVLESALLNQPSELRRILIHELFHFIWMRLGNARRRAWERLLIDETSARARGELGWSSESGKSDLTPSDGERRTLRWREYVCESFCDTAAWRHARIAEHSEFTLAARWRSRRQLFFDGLEQSPLAL